MGFLSQKKPRSINFHQYLINFLRKFHQTDPAYLQKLCTKCFEIELCSEETIIQDPYNAIG